MNACAVGAPLLPTLRIFSPEPLAIRFLLALMLAYKPTSPPSAYCVKSVLSRRALMQSIMGDFRPGQETLSFNSNDVMANTLQVRPGMDTTGEGSSLPSGNVGLDQIMSLMKGGR